MMDILYRAQWRHAAKNQDRADFGHAASPLVPILRLAIAAGLIFGTAGSLDAIVDKKPQHHTAK